MLSYGEVHKLRQNEIHEFNVGIAPSQSRAGCVDVNVEPRVIEVISCLACPPVQRFVRDFEGPELACHRLHVLQGAKPVAVLIVQEDAAVIALVSQEQLGYSRLSVIDTKVLYDVEPLWEVKHHFVAFAAETTRRTIPRFNLTPRDRQHSRIEL